MLVNLKVDQEPTATGVLNDFSYMKKGFTLLELMITIVILGVLATLITGNFFTSLKKGRDARRKADLDQIQKALEMYYEDKKNYPRFNIFQSPNYSLCETRIALNCGSEKVYIQKIPRDPQSEKRYEYGYDLTGSFYRLYACLENSQQILPYSSLDGTPTLICATQCKNNQGDMVPCIWAVSSSNVNP